MDAVLCYSFILITVFYVLYFIWEKTRKNIKKVIREVIKSLLVPRKIKNNLGFYVVEISAFILIIVGEYGFLWITKIILCFVMYIFFNIIWTIIEAYSRLLFDLEKNETQKYCILLYVIPIFLLVEVNCMEKYNNPQFIRIVRWILISIYLLIYYIYQKMMIEIMVTNTRVSRYPFWIIFLFQIKEDIIILYSGAYIIERCFLENFLGEKSGLELLYSVIVAFTTLDISRIEASGIIAKLYCITVIIANLIMFLCYIGYAFNKIKNEKNIERRSGMMENIENKKEQETIKKDKTYIKEDLQKLYKKLQDIEGKHNWIGDGIKLIPHINEANDVITGIANIANNMKLDAAWRCIAQGKNIEMSINQIYNYVKDEERAFYISNEFRKIILSSSVLPASIIAYIMGNVVNEDRKCTHGELIISNALLNMTDFDLDNIIYLYNECNEIRGSFDTIGIQKIADERRESCQYTLQICSSYGLLKVQSGILDGENYYGGIFYLKTVYVKDLMRYIDIVQQLLDYDR